MLLFSEAFLTKHFEDVELDKGEPQLGDLFFFKLQSIILNLGAHVGVYCGHGEIIHFEGKQFSSGGKGESPDHWIGLVHKEGLKPMLRSRELKRVLRKRGGIDPEVLEKRVQNAMDSDPPPYHVTKSNCMHFALKLLGVLH